MREWRFQDDSGWNRSEVSRRDFFQENKTDQIPVEIFSEKIKTVGKFLGLREW